jgi:dihydroxyacetone kinase
MKKLINDPRAVVREMLEGAVALAPGQALLEAESGVPAPALSPSPCGWVRLRRRVPG